MTENRLSRRLRRILLLVPYAIHNPGTTVDELAAKFGVGPEELRADLDLLFMCGLPGYGPGDLIEVDFAGDRVYVRMADYFSEPLRLTPAEALTLYAAASTAASLPGMEHAEALERGLRKLSRALGIGAGAAGALDVEIDTGAPAHIDTVRRALDEQKRVRIEYFSASRGEVTQRDVDPWGLVAALGRWYLVGFDHLTGDERMFRADRLKAAELLDEAAPVPGDFDPSVYDRAFVERGDQPELMLEISPDVARWFDDYYPVRAAEALPDGWVRARLAYSSERWAATLVLRLGAGCRTVEPEEVAARASLLGRSILQRHGA